MLSFFLAEDAAPRRRRRTVGLLLYLWRCVMAVSGWRVEWRAVRETRTLQPRVPGRGVCCCCCCYCCCARCAQPGCLLSKRLLVAQRSFLANVDLSLPCLRERQLPPVTSRSPRRRGPPRSPPRRTGLRARLGGAARRGRIEKGGCSHLYPIIYKEGPVHGVRQAPISQAWRALHTRAYT